MLYFTQIFLAGPLAVFSTLDNPQLLTTSHSEGSHNWMDSNNTSPLTSPALPGTLPPLTPQDRAKFMKIFLNSSPENGEISGQLLNVRSSSLLNETLYQDTVHETYSRDQGFHKKLSVKSGERNPHRAPHLLRMPRIA